MQAGRGQKTAHQHHGQSRAEWCLSIMMEDQWLHRGHAPPSHQWRPSLYIIMAAPFGLYAAARLLNIHRAKRIWTHKYTSIKRCEGLINMWASGFTARAANSSAAWRAAGNNAFGHVLLVFQSVARLNRLAGLILSSYWELWEKLSGGTAVLTGLSHKTKLFVRSGQVVSSFAYFFFLFKYLIEMKHPVAVIQTSLSWWCFCPVEAPALDPLFLADFQSGPFHRRQELAQSHPDIRWKKPRDFFFFFYKKNKHLIVHKLPSSECRCDCNR